MLSHGVTITLFVFLSIFIYILIQTLRPGAKQKYEKYSYSMIDEADNSMPDEKINLGN
jgi:cbb3-type cytochrome oxidase subunit 3